MTVRMRHTKGHSANRRSHHTLKGARLSADEKGVAHLRHRVSEETGMYRGKQVIDIAARTKREQERAKRRAVARGLSTKEATEESAKEPKKVASLEAMSKKQ